MTWGATGLPDQWQFFQNTENRMDSFPDPVSYLRYFPERNGSLGNSVRIWQDECGNFPDSFPS